MYPSQHISLGLLFCFQIVDFEYSMIYGINHALLALNFLLIKSSMITLVHIFLCTYVQEFSRAETCKWNGVVFASSAFPNWFSK